MSEYLTKHVCKRCGCAYIEFGPHVDKPVLQECICGQMYLLSMNDNYVPQGEDQNETDQG